MGGGSDSGGSGHGKLFQNKNGNDVEQIFVLLECQIFGQSGIAIFLVNIVQRFLWVRASRRATVLV